ncbi:MAG: ABC transporter permease [Eubacteriales bacterium]
MLAFRIALRFLKSGRGQTILIILGIAIGVSVQMFIGLLIQGLQKSLIETTIGSSSQITVTSTSDDKLIGNWKQKVFAVQGADSTLTHVSVAADGSAFVKVDSKSEPVLVRGFDMSQADGIYKLTSRLTEGALPQKNDEAAVGKELKDKLGLKLGDIIQVQNIRGQTEELTVSGFYDLKVSSINKSWLLVNLANAQDFFGYDDKITSIETQLPLANAFNAKTIAASIADKLNDSTLQVDNWEDQNQSLLSGLNGQSSSSLLIQVFVVVSVVLGISSVLSITVLQKSKQIGILKAMGLKDGQTRMVFLFEGLILGIFGAIIGVALGSGLLYSFTTFAVNADGTPVVPIYMDYGFIALSAGIAVVSSLIASVAPARKSSRLSPIEVIRNG